MSRPFVVVVLFQSTRPSWGATILYTLKYSKLKISIHAPLVGRDII